MAAFIPLVFCLGTSFALPSNRQQLSYDYYDDDSFREEAVFLTPADRQARHSSDLSLEFPQLDESFSGPDVLRTERDGGSHGSAHGRRGGRRNNRLQQQQQQNQRQNNQQSFREEDLQEDRGGRQSGATGPALGVLSNPPTEDGSYNFNFSNDDGTSRQESGAPSSVSGSYSFITPEGELVDMQYTADEFGFHASGSHMPTTPPPPPHVQRLLDHLAKVNGGVFY